MVHGLDISFAIDGMLHVSITVYNNDIAVAIPGICLVEIVVYVLQGTPRFHLS